MEACGLPGEIGRGQWARKRGHGVTRLADEQAEFCRHCSGRTQIAEGRDEPQMQDLHFELMMFRAALVQPPPRLLRWLGDAMDRWIAPWRGVFPYAKEWIVVFPKGSLSEAVHEQALMERHLLNSPAKPGSWANAGTRHLAHWHGKVTQSRCDGRQPI